MLEFDSLNPYQKLAVFHADTAEQLTEMLSSVNDDYTLISIHNNATMTKWTAIVRGKIRVPVAKTKSLKISKGAK